ncbi:MAG TPA: hypothetical protein VEU33_23730 [Archangium sp.]|nr:hypothetical protein [Archangium sp.]
MRAITPVALCCAGLLTGCGYFGYYKHTKAPWAPPEQASAVEFPSSLEKGVQFTGPMLAALKVAMDEYRPPGLNPETLPLPDRCLARWEYINVRVLKASDDLFFVEFTPDLRKCGPGLIVPDAGATYAIDGKGRILARDF